MLMHSYCCIHIFVITGFDQIRTRFQMLLKLDLKNSKNKKKKKKKFPSFLPPSLCLASGLSLTAATPACSALGAARTRGPHQPAGPAQQRAHPLPSLSWPAQQQSCAGRPFPLLCR